MRRIILAAFALLWAVSAGYAQLTLTGAGKKPGGGGGGGITFTPTDAQTVNAGFSTSASWTANIGTASADRIVFVAVGTGNSIGTGPTLTINGVSATHVLDASQISLFYANVTSGSTGVTIAYTNGATVMADCSIVVGKFSGQSGGGTATPAHSGSNTTFQNQPISMSMTVDTGGIGVIVARGSSTNNTTTSTSTWTGTTSASGDEYQSTTVGNSTTLSMAHVTTAGTTSPTVTDSVNSFTGGQLAYAAWAP